MLPNGQLHLLQDHPSVDKFHYSTQEMDDFNANFRAADTGKASQSEHSKWVQTWDVAMQDDGGFAPKVGHRRASARGVSAAAPFLSSLKKLKESGCTDGGRDNPSLRCTFTLNDLAPDGGGT